MIIVTGATGNLGSRIVSRLLDRVPAREIGISVRDPRKAQGLVERGIRVRAGDFNDPGSLDDAFADATRVVIVSASIRGFDAAVAANRAAVDAARRAGAHHLVYTSHQAASETSLFPPMLVHAATEKYLATCGVPFTALRNGFYGSSLAAYLQDVQQTGRIVVPAAGPVSWTDHSDLAEVAALAVTEASGLNGVTAPLTGPSALDFDAITRIVSEILGSTVELVVVDDDEWKATQIAAGMPTPAAEFALTFFHAARNGEFATTDHALERAVGHPATPVRAVIEHILARR